MKTKEYLKFLLKWSKLYRCWWRLFRGDLWKRKRFKRIEKKKADCEYTVHISEYILAPRVIEMIVLRFIALLYSFEISVTTKNTHTSFTWQEFVPREGCRGDLCEKTPRATPCWTEPVPSSSKTSPQQGTAEALSNWQHLSGSIF